MQNIMFDVIGIYLRKIKKSIILFVVIAIVSSIINIYSSYYNGIFIDLLSKSKKIESIYYFALFYLSCLMTDVIVKKLYITYRSKIQEKLIYDVYISYIDYLEKVKIEEFEIYNPTYLNQRINTDISSICKFFFNSYLNIFIDIIKIIVVLIIMALINLKIALITFPVMFIYGAVFLIYINPVRKKNYKLKEDNAFYYQVCNEQLELYKEIRINSSYKSSINRINDYFEKYFKSFIDFVKVSVNCTTALGSVSAFFQIILIIISGIDIIYGRMTIGQLIIINIYYSMLLSSINSICSTMQNYQETKNSIYRMKQLKGLDMENMGNIIIENISNIIIKDINFYYNNNLQKDNLKNISIEFEKGKIYIISGHNGAGKTTFINILLHLYSFNLEGEILINNTNILDINTALLREKAFAVCLQNEKYPDINVKDYLLENTNRNINDVYNFIYNNNLEEVYINNKFNLKEYLARSILSLSGGEKQKISFLRSIIKDASVIILDEINSNLDTNSIKKIYEYLERIKINKIIIIISHDEYIINKADSIISFNR